MSTFDFAPGYTPELMETPAVLMANFGDGYQQIARDGVNAIAQQWNLSFNGKTDADADAIILFFRQHGGAVPFDWTPPRSTLPIQCICQQWRRQVLSNGQNNLTAIFMQTFTPGGLGSGTLWDDGLGIWDQSS